MLILRPREPQRRHFGTRQTKHRIPHLFVSFIAAETLAVSVLSGRQGSTAIGRNRKREAIINADHRAGDHSAPRNPHHTNPRGIHTIDRADQRVRQYRISHCMIHPLILQRLRRVIINPTALGSRPRVLLPSFPDFPVHLPFDRNTDRRIATRSPLLHPILKGSATAAMHQHHGGHCAFVFVRHP